MTNRLGFIGHGRKIILAGINSVAADVAFPLLFNLGALFVEHGDGFLGGNNHLAGQRILFGVNVDWVEITG